MYGLRRFGIKLGLNTIKRMLKGVGNPHEQFKCIHIAGTNGKGSIASSLSTILHEAGYKVGLFTSPHLIKFNERICINNKQISDSEVVDAYNAVNTEEKGDREPTFFEINTAMAFYIFATHNVDWAVIETGMGGRLDSTNIIKPELSIITNISIEHTAYLGNTIAEISGEKAGIIKNKTPVISGVKQKTALDVISQVAVSKSATVYHSGRDFKVRRNKNGTFSYFGINKTWRDMKTGLLGNYQVDNAALTLAACEILSRKKENLSVDHIRKGLLKTRWPGRLEVISKKPFVIIDGAHNLNAARLLGNFISDHLKDKKVTLVIGMCDDKPVDAILKCLIPVCDKVVLTQPEIDRSIPPEKIYKITKDMISDITIISDVGEAVHHAINSASENDAVCIAGSLYLVGEAKAALSKDNPEIFLA